MKKKLFLVKWMFLSLLLLPFVLTNAGAEPTRHFFVEKAEVSKPNTLSIDVYDAPEIRAHLLGGELILSPSSMGYKRVIKPKLAIFGRAFLDSDTDNTSAIRGGAAYDMKINEKFSLGLNGEGILDTDSTVGVIGSAGGYFELPKTEKMGVKNLEVGLEVSISIDNDDTDAGVLLGLRWIPIPMATIDFIFFHDTGDKGNDSPAGSIHAPAGFRDGSIQTPASIRANLAF